MAKKKLMKSPPAWVIDQREAWKCTPLILNLEVFLLSPNPLAMPGSSDLFRQLVSWKPDDLSRPQRGGPCPKCRGLAVFGLCDLCEGKGRVVVRLEGSNPLQLLEEVLSKHPELVPKEPLAWAKIPLPVVYPYPPDLLG